MTKRENAITVRRKPKTVELFNVGIQPSIPTRGLSSILTRKEKAISLLREELL